MFTPNLKAGVGIPFHPAVVFDAQNGRVVRIHDAGDIKKGSEHRQKVLQFCDGKNRGIFINLGHEEPSLYGLGAEKNTQNASGRLRERIL